MQFFANLWKEKAARPPLIALGLIVLISFLWMLSSLGGEEPGPAETDTAAVDVVVRGQVERSQRRSAGESGHGPVTVHVQIPELAYQADALIEPEADGSFELPIRLQTEQKELHYSVDISQGDRRWNAIPPQKLSLSSGQPEVIELAELHAVPPADSADPRAHLNRSEPPDDARRERMEERRQKFKERKEQRKERRNRQKVQRQEVER